MRPPRRLACPGHRFQCLALALQPLAPGGQVLVQVFRDNDNQLRTSVLGQERPHVGDVVDENEEPFGAPAETTPPRDPPTTATPPSKSTGSVGRSNAILMLCLHIPAVLICLESVFTSTAMKGPNSSAGATRPPGYLPQKLHQ